MLWKVIIIWKILLNFSANNYQHIKKACVDGNNIQLYKDLSIGECEEKCNKDRNCRAFEYGVNYGGSGDYRPRDCQPQSSSNYAGCDAAHHNLDLYVKKEGKNDFYYNIFLYH